MNIGAYLILAGPRNDAIRSRNGFGSALLELPKNPSAVEDLRH